jgi:hypothetical protein
MTRPVDVHAIRVSYPGSANCRKSPVAIKNINTGLSENTFALWDTGATNSVITKSLADVLKLTPVSMTMVRGVHGSRAANIYKVNITLNNNQITLNALVTECDELSDDGKTGFLIGMNVIRNAAAHPYIPDYNMQKEHIPFH